MGRELTPEILLGAYAQGVFPMAASRDATDLHWMAPRWRGVFPREGLHISRSLRRTILRGDYSITIDRAFPEVVAACADRPETWLNTELFTLYEGLHRIGHAHSLEVWREGALIGGVFGVTLGRAFFGETMFSRETGGSKIALAYLVDRLRRAGFTLFDTQFLTPHLASLGAIEISREDYLKRLRAALDAGEVDFTQPATPTPQDLMQLSTQTS